MRKNAYSLGMTPLKKTGLASMVTPMKRTTARDVTPGASPVKRLRIGDTPSSSSSSSSGPKKYKVFEATSSLHKQLIWDLHTQKIAFQNEHEHIKNRVFDNDEACCRSWVLTETEPQEELGEASQPDETRFVGAITVRLNPYMHREGKAWVQVMNLSVQGERQGHGTRLFAAVEKLLQHEGVDAMALYPVQNVRATNFWNSMGFKAHEVSILPAEELEKKNGALLPEGLIVDGHRIMLPRWEKQLKPSTLHERLFDSRWHVELEDGTLHCVDTSKEQTWKPLKRSHWPLWRRVPAKMSVMDHDEVLQRYEAAQTEKQHRKPL